MDCGNGATLRRKAQRALSDSGRGTVLEWWGSEEPSLEVNLFRDLKNEWLLGRQRVGHKKVAGRRNGVWENPESGQTKASLRGEL